MVVKKADQGQEKPASETDIEKAKKEIEKAALEIEKLKLELENLHSLRDLNQAVAIKTAVSGLIPTPSTKPLEGTMGVGVKAGYLSDIIAYRAMEDVASDITAEIATHPGKSILIVHNPDIFPGSTIFCEVVSYLKKLEEIVGEQIEENNRITKVALKEKAKVQPPGVKMVGIETALGLGSVALDTATKVAEYLRSNYTLTGRDITIQDEALSAIISGKLVKKGFRVYIENFYLVDNDFCTGSVIITSISTLLEKYVSLEATIPLLKKPGNEEQPLENKQAIEKSTAILKTVKEYLQEIKTSDKPEILPRLAVAMGWEYIRRINPDYLLNASVVSSGGDVLTKQSLIPGRSYFGHIAGCSVRYLLGEKEGNIISANTLSTVKSYIVKPDKIVSDVPKTIRI